jgi:hypothetical protein
MEVDIVADTQAFKLSFSLEDGGGLRSSMVLYGLLDPTQTITAILTEATAQAGLLNAVSDQKILDSRLEIFVPVGDQSAYPKNGVNAEKTMLITFNDSETPVRAYGQDTPGVANAILTSPDVVDTSDTDYTAWRDSFIGAKTHWQLTDANQSFLTAARTVAVTFRKRRRAQRAVSGEAG